ncbi:reverse transcriptase domain-containing protein [Tanacetum coccineum]
MYPFPEEEEELTSLMGYPYKCFLQLSKEYSQIRITADDEEKTGFHMEEGVYCFTHMPKELKKLSSYTLEDDGEGPNKVGDSKRTWLDERSRRSPLKDKKETGQVANIGRPKRKRRSNVMSTAKKRDNKFCTIGKEGRNPYTCLLCQGGNRRTDGREGRLEKWAAKVRTYDISYIPRKEVEGSVVKKFFGQGEQVERTPDANEGGTLTLSKKIQAKSTPAPRAWRLYLGKETIKEDSDVGIILVSPEEKMLSYAIRLKFNASNHVIDCEALLVGLAASANQGMKDLHVFIDSLTLVAQVEGNHTQATKQEIKYKEEIIDATTPFHRKTFIEMENVGLTFAQVSLKAHREGVGLRVAYSHIGNHPKVVLRHSKLFEGELVKKGSSQEMCALFFKF